MKAVQCTCRYCDHKWDPNERLKMSYGWAIANKDRCPKCRSRDIDTYEYTKVDYYCKVEGEKLK